MSVATDLGMGQPMDFALRTCILALRLAETLGLSATDLRTIYYVALMRSAGCTAEAPFEAILFGDEIAARVWLSELDMGQPAQVLAALIGRVGADASPLRRARMVTTALGSLPRLASIEAAHCEVAQQLASYLGLEPEIQLAVSHVFERWDGRGLPRGLKGESIATAARVVAVAWDATFFHERAGAEAATTVIKQRAGGKYDPDMAAHFCRDGPLLLASAGEGSAWETALAAEPGHVGWLSDEEFDRAARGIAAFADLVSPYFAGHSSGVSDLAAAAAMRCGVPGSDASAIRLAGLLHDVGRAGVSASIWNKAGVLSDGERERVRLHPYYTERVLARAEGLATSGRLAALHHERLDGSGYHRAANAPALPMAARVLAAADVYHALREPRPYRSAFEPGAAADILHAAVRSGQLDGDAVAGVLGAAGHTVGARRRAWPAGLSEREVEVLRLIARGRSKRQVGQSLSVSPSTAGNHIQHIYTKLGVSTRAAATLFAMQHDLIGSIDAPEK
ncbi:MAG: HD domain-containing protein [Chloroflexi bacterium]|nr:HD domain-containing protein [Chloroflexota bacterium]